MSEWVRRPKPRFWLVELLGLLRGTPLEAWAARWITKEAQRLKDWLERPRPNADAHVDAYRSHCAIRRAIKHEKALRENYANNSYANMANIYPYQIGLQSHLAQQDLLARQGLPLRPWLGMHPYL